MTDAYAETDVWPNPPATPTPAPDRTESAPDASRVLGDAPTATGRREARYAEAILGTGYIPTESDRRDAERRARAVMAVADAEQAELRAEVERLAGHRAEWRDAAYTNRRQWLDALARAEAAEAERDTYREQWHQEVENFERETVRAEAAEASRDAAVARERGLRERVEALADEWDLTLTPPRLRYEAAAKQLRALAAEPAATTGEGSWFRETPESLAMLAEETNALRESEEAYAREHPAPVSSGEAATGEVCPT
jgi:hypothetical protein